MGIETDAALISSLQDAFAYLRQTDHKFLNGYVQKSGEDLAAIEAMRNEKREYIRTHQDDIQRLGVDL